MHQPLLQHPASYRHGGITVCRATSQNPRPSRTRHPAYPGTLHLVRGYAPQTPHPTRRHAGTPPTGRSVGRTRTAPLVFTPPTAEDVAYQAFLRQLGRTGAVTP